MAEDLLAKALCDQWIAEARNSALIQAMQERLPQATLSGLWERAREILNDRLIRMEDQDVRLGSYLAKALDQMEETPESEAD